MATAVTYNEKELLNRVASGDEKAFEELYGLYSHRIFGNLLKLVRSEDTAQELLQQVFIRIWEKRASIDADRSFRSYLFRIAENCVYDFFREASRHKRLQERLIEAVAGEYSYIEETLLQKESSELLQKALETLPAQRRKVFELCKLNGKSYKEVSELLDISTSTISDHIVKATKALADFYRKNPALIAAIVATLIAADLP